MPNRLEEINEMRAVVCEKLEGVAGLAYVEDWPEPTCGPGELLVDVKAAALGFPDVLQTQGKYQVKATLPFCLCGEGAGVVSKVGTGVTSHRIGDRVIVRRMWGFATERVMVKDQINTIMPMPAKLDFETASGICITYFTTYHALKQRAQLQPGETLLVLGAAGGVGTAAVDLGKAFGARVIAAASSSEKLEVARKLGADEIIDYSREDLKTRIKELTGGKGVDVTYDPVGGPYTEPALRGMAIGGRHLVIGFANGEIPRVPLNLALLKNCSIVGVFWGSSERHDRMMQEKNRQELWQLIDAGKLHPLVGKVYPLEQYREAFGELTERRALGKVVLRIAS